VTSPAPLHDVLPEYVLGSLPAAEMAAIDRQVAGSPELRREVDRLMEALSAGLLAGLPPLTPAPAARDRLLAAVGGGARFADRLAGLAQMFDLPVPTMRMLLDKVDDAGAWIGGYAPGLRFFNFTPGLRHAGAGADAGFVRLEPGAAFPRHRHLGHEKTMVLEGQMRDGEKRFGPGSVIEHDEGTEHGWVTDGTTSLLVVSLHHGLQPL
jgi:putative transcriptional regulator